MGVVSDGCPKRRMKRYQARSNMPGPKPRNPIDRFEEKFIPEPNTGCWLWVAASKVSGYGVFQFEGKGMGAHRAACKLFRGPVPDDMQVDHLCRTRSCVNPDHLEVVTAKENTRRSRQANGVLLFCKRGHRRDDPANVYIHPKRGTRHCKACNKLRQKMRSKGGASSLPATR